MTIRIATSCNQLCSPCQARLTDGLLDGIFMEYPDHSRPSQTQRSWGLCFTTENMPYQSCICRIAHYRGLPGRGGIANVASFARWRKMGWVTGPRWWVVNPGWVNLGFLIPNMKSLVIKCPHWTSPNHWVYGQCHGYFFRWCPIFPKWDSYQPLMKSLVDCFVVFSEASFPVQFLGCKAPLFLLTLRDIQCWLWRAMEPRRPPWILWPVVRPGCGGGSFSYGLTTDLFNLFSSVSFPSFPSFLFLLLLIPFPFFLFLFLRNSFPFSFFLFLPYCFNCYLLLSFDPSLPLVIPL